MLNICYDVLKMFLGVPRYFIAKPLKSAPQKIHIFPCVLYSIELLLVGLIIITFVDILRVGSTNKKSSKKKVTGQYLTHVPNLMVLLNAV